MIEERLMNALIAPHVSDKATRVGDQHNQVVFKVRRDADKATIRRAVEKMFEVKVDSVRVCNSVGKRRRFGSRMGQQNHSKKAYVRLAPGSDLDFLGGE